IETSGLLDVTIETADQSDVAPENEPAFSLSLVGQDHPGIVHEISAALAGVGASIDELETEVVPAPNGGRLFNARATVVLPAGVELETVEAAIESVSHDLMVDVDHTS
ncbi:MAG: glycine cleavage system protein R, partial [Acidimicrobiia bacterium]